MQEDLVPKMEGYLHRGRTPSPPKKRQVAKPTGDLHVGPDGQLDGQKNEGRVGTFGSTKAMPGRSKSGRAKRTLTKEEAERAREREGLPSRPTKPELDCSESRILLARILNGDVGQTHIYDNDLRALVQIRKETNNAEEAATKERMKASAAVSRVVSQVPSRSVSQVPSRSGSVKDMHK